MKMRLRHLLVAVAAALLVVVLVLSSWPATPAAPAPSAAARFSARPAGEGVDTAIVALGRIEPVGRVLRLDGPVGNDAGRIASISVGEGQRVARGQVLGVLDTEPRLMAALAQADANVAMKTAQLAQRLAEYDNTEQSLAAAVEQQAAERDRAQWDLERLSHLNKAGLYSDPALIDKRLALLSANRKLNASRLALERIQHRDARGHRLEEAVVRAELQAVEAAAEKARTDYGLSHFRAPVDGTILRLHARLGQQLGTDGFAEMGDVSTMMVRAEVFEADIAAVVPGQPATVTSRSLATSLQATVDRIGMAVGTQSVIREDPAAVLDSRVVEVFLKLDPASSARVSALTNLQVRVAIERVAGSNRPQLSRAD
jgi:HlyD family secretion protein